MIFLKVGFIAIFLISFAGFNTSYSQKKQKRSDTTLNQNNKVETNQESHNNSGNGPAMFWTGICGAGILIIIIVTIIAFKRASTFRKKFYNKN